MSAYSIESTSEIPKLERTMHAGWCDHRSGGDTHDDNMPYCYTQVHGVKLTADTGDKFPPNLWVYVTSPAHQAALSSGERATDDHLYDGIEMVTEHYVGDEWTERKFRLSADAARSLAATLTRAADIKQGLTR